MTRNGNRHSNDVMPVRRAIYYLLMWAAIILLWVVAAMIGAVSGKERRNGD